MLAVSGSAQSVFSSNQIEASEEKYLARRRYTDREQGERNKQGARNKTLILAACALGHVENTEERRRKRREIYLGTRVWAQYGTAVGHQKANEFVNEIRAISLGNRFHWGVQATVSLSNRH